MYLHLAFILAIIVYLFVCFCLFACFFFVICFDCSFVPKNLSRIEVSCFEPDISNKYTPSHLPPGGVTKTSNRVTSNE